MPPTAKEKKNALSSFIFFFYSTKRLEKYALTVSRLEGGQKRRERKRERFSFSRAMCSANCAVFRKEFFFRRGPSRSTPSRSSLLIPFPLALEATRNKHAPYILKMERKGSEESRGGTLS